MRALPFVIVLVALVLGVYAVMDVLRTPAETVRTLPKPLWLGLVVLLPIGGPIGWLLGGRPALEGAERPTRPGRPTRGARSPRPVRRQPVRQVPPDDDEEFLRSLKRPRDDQP